VEALGHLEEAARLLPDSVAAQAILVNAYFDCGQFDRFYVALGKIRQLTPVTAEDHLFLGHAIGSSHGPKRALPMLDRAVQMRDSPIARLLRADVLTRVASDSAAEEDVERSLSEVGVVKALLPNNPVSAAVSLYAHLVAACIYDGAGQPQKSEQMRREAGREADALQSQPPFPRAVRARLLYYEYVGDEAAIGREYQRTRGTSSAPAAGRSQFHALFRQGKFTEALKVLDESRTPGDENMDAVRRAFTLAQVPDDGPARALAVYERLRQGRQGKPFDGRLDFYPPFILHLLGRQQEATDYWRSVRAQSKTVRPAEIAYLSGLTSAEHLAGLQDTRDYQCECQFFIAMKCLSEGDRRLARLHFEKSVATRVLWFLEYEWSRSFLAQMDRDPEWPRWIRAK
jgi:hypothetical protein